VTDKEETYDEFAKRYWDEMKIELIKCSKCGWVHFLADDEKGRDSCFFCRSDAKEIMIPANYNDCPVGCTLSPINRRNYERK